MANSDQKTILIDNAYKEIKNICINLQIDTCASNLEVKSLLKLIINEWEEKKEQKKVLDTGKFNHDEYPSRLLDLLDKNIFVAVKI